VPTARIVDVAAALIGDRPIETIVTDIRPGEKLHEILVSEEEAHRTVARGNYYVIRPMLPELVKADSGPFLGREYSSADDLMSRKETVKLLKQNRLMLEDVASAEGELLR
jgi:UDP-glucose 4-epimerase